MLDPIGRREVLAAVEKLNREQGITVVLITHHMNEAEHADRVIVMNDGLVVMDGKPREVFTRKKELEDIGLAVPGHGLAALFPARGGHGRPRGRHHRRGMRRRHCEKFYLRGL